MSRKQNAGRNNNTQIGIIPLCTEHCALAFDKRPLKKIKKSVVRHVNKILKSDYELPHVCLADRPHATIRLPLDRVS